VNDRFESDFGTIEWIPYLTERPARAWDCDPDDTTGYRCYADTWPQYPSQKVAVVDEQEELPHRYSLSHNYPNPFNPTCTIEYSLAKPCRVEITIYNLLGRKVKTLVSSMQPAGPYQVIWDGKNDQGNDVASGVYFYRMKTDEYVDVKKMVVLK
jgi:hypothetical protein